MLARLALASLLLGGGCRTSSPTPTPRPAPSAAPPPTVRTDHERSPSTDLDDADPEGPGVERASARRDGGAPEPPTDREPSRLGSCTVELDGAAGLLRINGTALADYRLEALRAVLGEPDRVEQEHRRQRYERWGVGPDAPPHSTMIDVTDWHYVYDELGLVFRTRNGKRSRDEQPTELLLFFTHERRFTSTKAPAAVPRRRGGCALVIDGQHVDPSLDLIPTGVDYRTDDFDLFGRDFGSTSVAAQIDSVYAYDDRPAIRIYLDAAKTRRPSYAEIR